MGVAVTMVTSDGHSKIPMQEEHVHEESNLETRAVRVEKPDDPRKNSSPRAFRAQESECSASGTKGWWDITAACSPVLRLKKKAREPVRFFPGLLLPRGKAQ